MNHSQKVKRFEELGLRIKIMRARQRGNIDLASMEALRTMTSQAARAKQVDPEILKGLNNELKTSSDLSITLYDAVSDVERELRKHEYSHKSPYEIDGEIFDDEIYTALKDLTNIADRLGLARGRVLAQITRLSQEQQSVSYGPSIESVNAIVIQGPLSVSENHELINMVNEHHNLKEELGLR